MNNPDIEITSLVGKQTGLPLIQLKWGELVGQLTSHEAREHAYRILQAADAAESDLFLWEFATKKINVNPEAAAKVIAEFRTFREARLQQLSKAMVDRLRGGA
jgi:hypothetical protein